MTDHQATIIPTLRYRDANAAIDSAGRALIVVETLLSPLFQARPRA